MFKGIKLADNFANWVFGLLYQLIIISKAIKSPLYYCAIYIGNTSLEPDMIGLLPEI